MPAGIIAGPTNLLPVGPEHSRCDTAGVAGGGRAPTLQISSSVRPCATNSLRVGMSTPYTLGNRTGGDADARYTCRRRQGRAADASVSRHVRRGGSAGVHGAVENSEGVNCSRRCSQQAGLSLLCCRCFRALPPQQRFAPSWRPHCGPCPRSGSWWFHAQSSRQSAARCKAVRVRRHGNVSTCVKGHAVQARVTFFITLAQLWPPQTTRAALTSCQQTPPAWRSACAAQTSARKGRSEGCPSAKSAAAPPPPAAAAAAAISRSTAHCCHLAHWYCLQPARCPVCAAPRAGAGRA